jgi:hypothetical protein
MSKRSRQRRGLEAPASFSAGLGSQYGRPTALLGVRLRHRGTLKAEFLLGGRYVDDVLMACYLIKESEPRA